MTSSYPLTSYYDSLITVVFELISAYQSVLEELWLVASMVYQSMINLMNYHLTKSVSIVTEDVIV